MRHPVAANHARSCVAKMKRRIFWEVGIPVAALPTEAK
jgi:hypothetical protein